jgi:hypothetical protein
VQVEGQVLPPITVSPSSLFLGVVRPGEEVTKLLVVRGREPFRILGVESENDSFRFDLTASETVGKVHVVPVTFLSHGGSGEFHDSIRIQTDAVPASSELVARAIVSSPE